MTIDGLLTFLALLIAVYTIMSRAQRLNLSLKIRIWHWAAIILLLLAVHVLELPKIVAALPRVPPVADWVLEPKEAAYLLLLAGALCLGVLIHFSPLPRSRVRRLGQLIDELTVNGQTVEVLALLQTHLDRLVRIYKGDFLLPRLRARLVSRDRFNRGPDLERLAEQLLQLAPGEPLRPPRRTLIERAKHVIGSIPSRLGELLPSAETQQEAVGVMLRSTLLRPECVQAIAKSQAHFGLRVLAMDAQERFHFSDEFLRALMLDTSSILYWEIRNNQNYARGHRYNLPEGNRLLRYLFADAKNAEALGVWEPVGEAVIAELDRRHRSETDRYNDSLMDYRDRYQWKCPVFVGIRFFDIMVSEAIAQNICWHMWLYYYPHFVDGICRNYAPDEQRVELDDEFPTVYSFLLYEIVSTLRHWIAEVRDLPPDQENIVLEDDALTHENGNIIKSSILVLGMCLKTILVTERIPPRLKSYLASIGLDLFLDFVRVPKLASYAGVLRASLLAGGFDHRDTESAAYTGNLIAAVVRNDNVPHRHGDVTALLDDLLQQFAESAELDSLAQYVDVQHIGDHEVSVAGGHGGRRYTMARRA
ncbi:hypothetical protein P3W85_00490 [Cupriavidus basilensis]|uniref:Uncharacterized protein n=1 Tax=Cupriavidus basilensis TaxID=68895 RepID=A0ABT6AI10_9BURK|nr:hypothetical protein [Cupriavidus basilensis]MDF3831446.1 hypothetical protein [Cupriavidus basilensis]